MMKDALEPLEDTNGSCKKTKAQRNFWEIIGFSGCKGGLALTDEHDICRTNKGRP